MGHFQTRAYTTERYRIEAKTFKKMLSANLGKYEMSWTALSDEHRLFELFDTEEWGRLMLFNIGGEKWPVPLSVDTRSVSAKLYLVCPCCTQQRQHLYAMSYGYACRVCARLHYPCQSEREEARLRRKIRKLRSRIWVNERPDGYNLTEDSQYWPKPKGMRWATFESLRFELRGFEDRHNTIMFGMLMRLQGQIGLPPVP